MRSEADAERTTSSDSPEERAEESHLEDEVAKGFDPWRRKSAIGGIGTGIARGLQNVFAPPVDEVAIVAAVPGEPPNADKRVRVILDPDDPTKSIALVPNDQTDPPSV